MKSAGHVSAATDGQILVFGGMNLESMQLYSNVFVYSIEEAQWRQTRQECRPRFTPG